MPKNKKDSKIDSARVRKWQTKLHGKVLQSDDADYDTARHVWNGMIDKYPALIVQCKDEDDVMLAVEFARDHFLPIAVRGGGHNVAGFGTVDDGMVIDLALMKKIDVNPVNRTARAQGGLTWSDFDKATQAHALATTGGLVSETGIAGLTLGGGIGWLMRRDGLTLDNLQSVEMITADAKPITASAMEHSDLFWGVRGGGGNFGIVTSFEYLLHPVGPNIYGGALFYPLAKARELLRFYRDWVSTVPDEMTTMLVFLTAPPESFVPKELVGKHMVAVALCYVGAIEEGERLLKPLRNFAEPAIDVASPMPYLMLQSMFDASAPRGINAYWKTEYLRWLDDGAIDVLSEYADAMKSPFSAIHVHHVEGAVKRVNAQSTAFANRDAPFILNIVGMWQNVHEAPMHTAWVRNLAQAIRPFSTGAAYVNFLADEGETGVKAAYTDDKYTRLAALKQKYDPDNIFHVNQNIKPTHERMTKR